MTCAAAPGAGGRRAPSMCWNDGGTGFLLYFSRHSMCSSVVSGRCSERCEMSSNLESVRSALKASKPLSNRSAQYSSAAMSIFVEQVKDLGMVPHECPVAPASPAEKEQRRS